jgi:hypothetical protein
MEQAAKEKQLKIKRPEQYIGTRNLRAKEEGRYNDLDQNQPMTVWSTNSGDDIPALCRIPQLEAPTQDQLPLSLKIDEDCGGHVDISSVDKILRWAEAVSYTLGEVDVVVGRSLLKTLCQTPYNRQEEWEVKLYRYQNTLCLESVEKSQHYGPESNYYTAWGKVFEDVMKTGGRRTPGYAGEDVDIRMPRLIKLGPLNILSNSRIACQLPGENQDTRENYVELKTAPVGDTDKQESKFLKYQSRNIWAHCAPLGIDTVYIGRRTAEGELEEITAMTTQQLAEVGARWWQPEVMLSFMVELLGWLKKKTSEGVTYTVSYDGKGYPSHVKLVPAEQDDLVRIVRASFPEE